MSAKSAWTQSKNFSNMPPIDFNCLNWDCLSPYGETRHSFASWLFLRLGSATHTNVTLKSSLSDSTLWTTETAALHCMQLPHFLRSLLLWCLWKPSVSACTLLRECERVWSTYVNSLSRTHRCMNAHAVNSSHAVYTETAALFAVTLTSSALISSL